MSTALLDRISKHVEDADLNSGFTTKYFRWSDKDLAGKTPFLVYRQTSSPASNVLLQQIDVLIQQCSNPPDVETGDANMQSIIELFRGDTVQPGIVRFDPVGAVQGPVYLENGRPLWELTVRCFTEDL